MVDQQPSEQPALRVLVADDDRAALRAASRVLKRAGYEVLSADGGRDAWSLCRSGRPQLVLSDVEMPDMDGFELCRRIKSDPELRSTIVVLISGRRISPEDHVDGLGLGADGYLRRPVGPKELVAWMGAYARIQGSEAQLRRLAADLERRVRARTAELAATVDNLEREVERRRQTEAELRASEGQLRDQAQLLEQKNVALGELLGQLEREKQRLARDVDANVQRLLLPLVGRLREQRGRPDPAWLDLLEEQLEGLATPLGRRLDSVGYGLTPREIEICTLIRAGHSTGDIAGLLHLSEATVQTHRRSIRGKLGIKGGRGNLSVYLRSIEVFG